MSTFDEYVSRTRKGKAQPKKQRVHPRNRTGGGFNPNKKGMSAKPRRSKRSTICASMVMDLSAPPEFTVADIMEQRRRAKMESRKAYEQRERPTGSPKVTHGEYLPEHGNYGHPSNRFKGNGGGNGLGGGDGSESDSDRDDVQSALTLFDASMVSSSALNRTRSEGTARAPKLAHTKVTAYGTACASNSYSSDNESDDGLGLGSNASFEEKFALANAKKKPGILERMKDGIEIKRVNMMLPKDLPPSKKVQELLSLGCNYSLWGNWGVTDDMVHQFIMIGKRKRGSSQSSGTKYAQLSRCEVPITMVLEQLSFADACEGGMTVKDLRLGEQRPWLTSMAMEMHKIGIVELVNHMAFTGQDIIDYDIPCGILSKTFAIHDMDMAVVVPLLCESMGVTPDVFAGTGYAPEEWASYLGLKLKHIRKYKLLTTKDPDLLDCLYEAGWVKGTLEDLFGATQMQAAGLERNLRMPDASFESDTSSEGYAASRKKRGGKSSRRARKEQATDANSINNFLSQIGTIE